MGFVIDKRFDWLFHDHTIADITDLVSTADARYLKLDCSNDPLTADLDVTGSVIASNEIKGLELVADHNMRITGNYALKWRDSADTSTRAYMSYDGVLRLINSSGSISLDPTTQVDVSGNLDVTGTSHLGDGGTTNYTEIKTDGEINLHGTARVYKNEWITVNGLKAPGVKPAILVDWGIGCGYEFSNGTDDTICTTIRLPKDMDNTVAPEFKIGFASDTDTGDVVWQLEYLYVSPNEDTTAAAQETLTTTQTISATADGLTIATITGMDLPSATDQLLKLRIKRLGADASDTLADDCVFTGCGLKYVADKLGQAL